MSGTDHYLNCGKDIHNRQLRDLATYISYRARAAQNTPVSDYRKYLIFSTPRVGSTLLTKQIQQTNLLGSPEEWFNSDFITAYLGLQSSSSMDFNLFAEQVIRGSATPNHIFGVNVHVHQYHQLLNSGIDLLHLKFEKFYYIHRRDKIKQAYSWAKAYKTACWNRAIEKEAGFHEGVPVEISAEEVAQFLHNICKDKSYFDNSINPRITLNREFYYLDLVADECHSAMNSILQDFGLPTVHKKLKIQTSRQSTNMDETRINEIKKYFGMVI